MADKRTVNAHAIERGEVFPPADGQRLDRWTKPHAAAEGRST